MNQDPADCRDRLRRARDAGLARAEAARTVGVTDRTIRRGQQRRRETGRVAPLPRRGRSRRIDAVAETALREQVRRHPDATLAEHGAFWAAAQDRPISVATMSRARRRLGLPLKTSPGSPPNATQPDVRHGGRPSRPSPRTASSFGMKRPRPRA
jgi:transposase